MEIKFSGDGRNFRAPETVPVGHKKSLVTLVCLEMAPKMINGDHVFSLWRVVLCKGNTVLFTELQ